MKKMIAMTMMPGASAFMMVPRAWAMASVDYVRKVKSHTIVWSPMADLAYGAIEQTAADRGHHDERDDLPRQHAALLH
jgi:hypothetical protein